MRQINLLPWRERRLEAMKRTFVMQTVFTVVVVIFIVLAAHKSLTQRLVKQEGVNRILEQHIADLGSRFASHPPLRGVFSASAQR